MILIQWGFCKEPMLQRAPAVVQERGQADELRNVGNLNRHSYTLYNLKEEKRRNAFRGLTVWVSKTPTLWSTDKHLG